MYFRIQTTETRNHVYIVEAECRDTARDVYQNMDYADLIEYDLDGQSSWDSHPWDIDEDATADDMTIQLERIGAVLQRRTRSEHKHLRDMDYNELSKMYCTQCHSTEDLGDSICPTAMKCNERTCSYCCEEEGGCCA